MIKFDEILRQDSKEPLIIAETAFSHEGSVQYLKELILELEGQNNIALKVQMLIDKKDFLTSLNPIYEKIDNWILSESEWLDLIDYAYEKNVSLILAILDNKALELIKIKKNKLSAIEIHPSCIPDYEFFENTVEFCKVEKIPLILGISGFSFEEIEYIIKYKVNNIEKHRLVLMYGFQNYPTKLETLNLNRMILFSNKLNLKLAYADHTEYNSDIKDHIISMVYGMGINIIEIHYVLRFGEDRIDYITAYDADHILSTRNRLMSLSDAKGKFEFKMDEAEKAYSFNFRKIPVYAENFKQGHILDKQDIKFKRTNRQSEFTILESDVLVGRKIICDVSKNNAILNKELI